MNSFRNIFILLSEVIATNAIFKKKKKQYFERHNFLSIHSSYLQFSHLSVAGMLGSLSNTMNQLHQRALEKTNKFKAKCHEEMESIFKIDDTNFRTFFDEIAIKLVVDSRLSVEERLKVFLETYIALYAPGLNGPNDHIKYLFRCAIGQLVKHIESPKSMASYTIEVIQDLRKRGSSSRR